MPEPIEPIAPTPQPESPPEQPEKLLRQSEVDQMMEERLLRERRVMAQELAAHKAANERATREAEAQKAAREAAEAALRQREDALFALEMQSKAREALITRGLPQSLLGALRLHSMDALGESLAAAEAAFRAAVEQGVRDRLRGHSPQATPAPAPRTLNYQQAAALYQSDRAAYQQQFGGK